MSPKTRLAILIIALFSLLQLSLLTQPSFLAFDEQHYVKVGRLMLKGYPDYNIEHPPLGKEIIAVSMKILGDNPWGWRLPGVTLSIATLAFVFLSAKKFLGERTALLATFLLALDPLWISISRLAMLDIFATFFIVLSLVFALYYLERPSLKLATLTGVFLGASLAAKLAGVLLPLFVATLIASAHLLKNTRHLKDGKGRTPVSHFLGFLLTTSAVFLLLFLPIFLRTQEGGPTIAERFILLAASHVGVTASVAKPLFAVDASLWFILPTVGAAFAPTLLFFSPLSGWVLLAAIFFLIRAVVKNPNYESFKPIFLLLAFMLLYIPWLLESRPDFLYHIFPLLPLVYLIQARFGATIWEKGGWGRILFKSYLTVTAFSTVFLLPYLFVIQVPDGMALTSSFLLLTLTPALTLWLFFPKKATGFLDFQI